MDTLDTLAPLREKFCLPEHEIYLDGNSLGPLLRHVEQRLLETVRVEWGEHLISSWNRNHWIDLASTVAAKIAPLLGADPTQVICADSVSVNLFKLLATAIQLQPGRADILSTNENFPTDLYMIQGLEELLGEQRCRLVTVRSADLIDNIDTTTNLVVLSHTDFRTAALLDLKLICSCAHQKGAMVLVDVSHTVGIMPLCLDELDVDFAVGCGYKFLNGGPGAPAFLYVNRRHHNKVQQPLSGWMGHQAPFDFDQRYRPATGISQYLSGTPGILGLSALDAAMDIWREIDLNIVRKKSVGLTSSFIDLITSCTELSSMCLVSPLDHERRASQVSFCHDHGYAIVQALIEAGVICDFREPDLIRFGFSPLYIRYVDVLDAVNKLQQVFASRLFEQDRFQLRQPVT